MSGETLDKLVLIVPILLFLLALAGILSSPIWEPFYYGQVVPCVDSATSRCWSADHRLEFMGSQMICRCVRKEETP